MKHLNLNPIAKTVLATALVAVSTLAAALEIKPFSQNELGALQGQGKPVTVHFHADWCPTCVSQAKSLEALKSDPDLKSMTVLVADYDKEKELRKTMKVRSQSVMVVYKGNQEITRVPGQTQAGEIKAALVKAL